MVATMKTLIAIVALGAANVFAQSSVLSDLAAEPACVITAVTATAQSACGVALTSLNSTCACVCPFQTTAIQEIDQSCGGYNATLVTGLIQLQMSLCSNNITGAAANGTCPTGNTTNTTSANASMSGSMSATGSMSSTSASASTSPSSGAIALGSNGLVGAAAALFAGILAVA